MNAKAKYLLTCALSKSEYDKIISCDCAREIWDWLQTLHEGTNQVKETKISMLLYQYEMFKMLEYKNIDEITTRFLHIINKLKALGKRYTNAKMVRQILRNLSKSLLMRYSMFIWKFLFLNASKAFIFLFLMYVFLVFCELLKRKMLSW